jgi:hypothetical protein
MKNPRDRLDERMKRVWDAAYASAFAAEFRSQYELVRELNRGGEKLNDSYGGVLEDSGERIAEAASLIANHAVTELERYEGTFSGRDD